ncbi:hypothetical protein [Streptomyces sp. NL15-2K]|uniref:hypothetical protein n=1 Tax=Streptomyces sp. NL15-2K TaxID=376149 RepID=UPI000F5889E4|nr:hypothetical protein [Kutzneria buriramensis]WKX09262.1 hypothetical protein Q4V64_17885 [Kutzneria buriramensis]
MRNATVPAGPPTSPPFPSPGGPVERWLASAHPSPETVRNEWISAGKLALIPLGKTFDAVRIPEPVVYSAAQSNEPSTVGPWLARHLHGPVIHDPGFRRYYALVPPGTAPAWAARSTECLSDGTYLGVPRTDRTELDEHTQASYWSVPMARPGDLCRTADVLELVLLGHVLADDEDDES